MAVVLGLAGWKRSDPVRKLRLPCCSARKAIPEPKVIKTLLTPLKTKQASYMWPAESLSSGPGVMTVNISLNCSLDLRGTNEKKARHLLKNSSIKKLFLKKIHPVIMFPIISYTRTHPPPYHRKLKIASISVENTLTSSHHNFPFLCNKVSGFLN